MPAGTKHLSGAQGDGQLPEDPSLPLASTPPALPGGAGDGQISDSQPKIAGLFLSPPVDTPYCRSSVRLPGQGILLRRTTEIGQLTK